MIRNPTSITEHHGHVYAQSFEEKLGLVSHGRVWFGPTINETSTATTAPGPSRSRRRRP